MTEWPRVVILSALLLLPACQGMAPKEAPEDARTAFTPAAPVTALSASALAMVDGETMPVAVGMVTGKYELFRSVPMADQSAMADVDPQQIRDDLGRALGARFKSVGKAASMAEAVQGGSDMILVTDLRVRFGNLSGEATEVALEGTFLGQDGAVLGKVAGNGRHELPWPAWSYVFRPAWVSALADFMSHVDSQSAAIAGLAPQHRGAPTTVTKAAKAKAAASAPPVAVAAPEVVVQRFPSTPAVSRFPRGSERPDDVAVVIGNADYSKQGKDIPDVKPAYADAEGMRLYATQALGIRDGNVIFLKDATGAQMIRVFGSKDDHRGQLYDWIKPGKSRVFVYYSGHGAPGRDGGSPYLVPSDADSARIELSGYPIKTLYDNLGKLPAESVTVVLEACFSGLSQSGSVLGQASPVYFDVKPPPVPAKLTVVTAGAANQVASWEQDGSSGLFTKYFLKGMAGEASHFGRPSLEELDRYLKDTLTYYARRFYGRDQTAQIVKGGTP